MLWYPTFEHTRLIESAFSNHSKSQDLLCTQKKRIYLSHTVCKIDSRIGTVNITF